MMAMGALISGFGISVYLLRYFPQEDPIILEVSIMTCIMAGIFVFILIIVRLVFFFSEFSIISIKKLKQLKGDS